jgi:phage baseplate assembly protein W
MNIRKNTYGINFPFDDSDSGDFLLLTEIPETEIKSNLIHLLLTRKGSRYYLPDFGSNLYQYVFEPLDDIVIGKIEDEINDAVERYIPNLKISKITIERFYDNIEYVNDQKQQHTIKIKIDYVITSRTFQSPDTVTIVL